MDRRKFITIGGTTALGALAGCLSTAQEDDASQPGTTQSTSKITVQKTREVTGDPDRATVEAGVETRADTVTEVRNTLTTTSEEIREALLDYGIEEDALTTTQFDIHEDHQYRRAQEDPRVEEPEQPRYIGRHILLIELTDIDDVGPVIDLAVDAGATRIGRIEFTVSDETREELREQALQQAIQAAETEATLVADETNTEISRVVRVDTTDSQVIPYRTEFAAASLDSAEAPPVRIEPNDVSVRASVTIEYRIQ